MTVEVSRLALYEVEGQAGSIIVSKLSLYAVEGGAQAIYASRASLYVVEGPEDEGPDIPPVEPMKSRRRALLMP